MYKRFTDILRTDNRIFGLDIMRFTAIILVVMRHSRWMTSSFPKFLHKALYGSGILGVELFFVLSGYLIGAILLKEFEKNNFSLNFNTIKNFWIRRWFRTIPNYYLILFVYILVYFSDMPGSIWKYVFFLQNIWNHPPYFFEESWSLCIEEISYLISPLILALSAKFFTKKGKSSQRIFLYVSIFLIIIITFLRLIYSACFLQPNYKWSYHFREVAAIRLDSIYYGFIMAYMAAKFPDKWKKMSIPLFIIGFAAILLLMCFQKYIVEQYAGQISNTFFFTFLSMAIACILPYLSGVKTTKFQFLAKPITAISIISYSLYLINGGLIAGNFKKYFFRQTQVNFTSGLFIYISYWFLCIAVSILIYLFFEKPITDLRNKIATANIK